MSRPSLLGRAALLLYAGLEVILFLAGTCLILAFYVGDLVPASRSLSAAARIVLLAGGGLAFVAALLLVHRMWAVLQAPGSDAVAPWKAVLLLFVPLYNLYWVFRAFGEYPAAFNKFVRWHRVGVRELADLHTSYILFSLIIGFIAGFVALGVAGIPVRMALVEILLTLAALSFHLVVLQKTLGGVAGIAAFRKGHPASPPNGRCSP